LSKYPIQRFTQSLVLDFSEDDDQIVSDAVDLNGRLYRVVLVNPELDGEGATATLDILDSDGLAVYTNSAIAESTTENDTLSTPKALSGSHTLRVTTSTAMDADKTFEVVLLIDRG